ncbi:MAG: patatin-like phospholipase family protein [Oscillospiraceae bacterium]
MKKLGIVLAGGGTRGAYQMGFWKAIRELGVEFDIVTGTSIGSLNGALMAQDAYDACLDLWENISLDFAIKTYDAKRFTHIKDPRKKNFAQLALNIVKNKGADVLPMEENLERMVDEEKIRNSEIDFGLVAVEFPSMKPYELPINEIPNGKLTKYLMASASCYPAFPVTEIDAVKFVDGGFYDNLPISLAVKMGATDVIAVDLKSIGQKRKFFDRNVNVSYIKSYWDLGSFLDFDKTVSKRNIVLGYNDTMKFFGKYDGNIYTFPKGNMEQNGKQYGKALGEISEYFEKTFSDINLREELLLKRIAKELEIIENKDIIDDIDLINAFAEISGEVFDFEPEKIYEIGEFNTELKTILFETLSNNKTPFKQRFSSFFGLSTKSKKSEISLEGLKNLGQRQIVALFYEMIQNFMAENENKTSVEREITTGALLFIKEFVAALYLSILTY